MQNIKKNNHYVPQMYLKNWSMNGRQIWGHRLLVSNENLPEWELKSIRSVANHDHLYTKKIEDNDTDELENWFSANFEAPAEKSIAKVLNNQVLLDSDFERLINLAASQIVRTPSYYAKSVERWKKHIPIVIEETVPQVLKEIEDALKNGKPIPPRDNEPMYGTLPVKVSKIINKDEEQSYLKFEATIGRSSWQYDMEHILNKTIKKLHTHDWSIIKAAHGMAWATSDDPVICLNYYGKDNYDFGGGWGVNGANIIFPISPWHILFTQIGTKKDSNLFTSVNMSLFLQRIIIEHAHRWVFSMNKIPIISHIRKRVVSKELYEEEKAGWENWNDEQGKHSEY